MAAHPSTGSRMPRWVRTWPKTRRLDHGPALHLRAARDKLPCALATIALASDPQRVPATNAGSMHRSRSVTGKSFWENPPECPWTRENRLDTQKRV